MGGGDTGLLGAGSRGGDGGGEGGIMGGSGGADGGESGNTVGEVLGLCTGDGSGLAGLSGMMGGLSRMASGFLGGETHRERLGGDASSGPLLLLFLYLPLWLTPLVPVEVPVEVPGLLKETVPSEKYTCPKEVFGGIITGLLTVGDLLIG